MKKKLKSPRDSNHLFLTIILHSLAVLLELCGGGGHSSYNASLSQPTAVAMQV